MPVPAKQRPRDATKNENAILGLFAQAQTAYDAAISEARISVTHTQTEGWQRLYQGFTEADRASRRQHAVELRKLADKLEDEGLTEVDEKELKKVVSDAVERRENRDGFDLHVVRPVRQPAFDCEAVVTQALADARRLEHEAPLLSKDAEETMVGLVAGLARATWSTAKGLVEIREPANGAGSDEKVKP